MYMYAYVYVYVYVYLFVKILENFKKIRISNRK
jgi:hypothetical protein